ncbi:MAG TPA: acyl-CoA dehydrogenase family protein, partial [Acidimicrobiia bacterium]|nr:acyl-CoA dehydrogenase family protein [Acidimicrobiia bacterium]
KDKLGTRGMASGEIDFDDAVAYPIGRVDDGFKIAVGDVLNTSRWLTAVGAAGMMRRAVLEASAYAEHRRAFGHRIGEFPAIQQTLESMRAEWLTALQLCWLLTGLEDRIDSGTADEATTLLHRFLVNVVKYVTTISATQVVRDAIEIFGGNGTIEDFSVLPRLYRDAIVYESWEGTHNVIAQQVFNDCTRLPLLDVIADRVTSVEGKRAVEDARHALTDPAGVAQFRPIIERIARALVS